MNINTWTGQGGVNQWAIEKAAKKAPKPTGDKSWGMEVGGDLVFCVETANGGVHITHIDYDEDGNTESKFRLTAYEAEWLRDHLTEALKLLAEPISG